jgi:hypothetical protein
MRWFRLLGIFFLLAILFLFGAFHTFRAVACKLVRVLNTGVRTADIAEPGKKNVACSVFNDMLHDEMQRTFEHAEKYGWGV